jgi:hypothetical protein
VPDEADLKQAAPADSSWLGIREMVGLFLKRKKDIMPSGDQVKQTLALELESILLAAPGGRELLDGIDFTAAIDEATSIKLVDAVQAAGGGSEQLRACLAAAAG